MAIYITTGDVDFRITGWEQHKYTGQINGAEAVVTASTHPDYEVDKKINFGARDFIREDEWRQRVKLGATGRLALLSIETVDPDNTELGRLSYYNDVAMHSADGMPVVSAHDLWLLTHPEMPGQQELEGLMS